MMKALKVIGGLGLVVALGVFPIVRSAEATSTKQIGDPLLTVQGSVVSFFLGEDGGVWYTSTSPTGVLLGPGTAYAGTGNAGNPFDQAAATGQGVGGACTALANCNGFVSGAAGALPAACAATGDTCSGYYARVPGAGSFIDSPSTFNVVAGGLPPLCVGTSQITVTGGDNQFWYTRFDSFANGVGGAAFDASCPPRDPFNTATEANAGGPATGTGFVAITGLTGTTSVCATDARTCVGLWVRFP